MPTPAEERLRSLEARLEGALARIALLESKVPNTEVPKPRSQADPGVSPRIEEAAGDHSGESVLASKLASKEMESTARDDSQSQALNLDELNKESKRVYAPAATTQPPESESKTSSIAQARTKKKTSFAMQEKSSRDKMSIERFVGGRLFAIAGALIITSGVALFSKFAWDQGWFNTLSPTGKAIMSASFGFTLLIAARIVQAKISLKASIGAYAAGLGVLYATAYTVYGRFELVPHAVGFMLLALVSLLGVAIGTRTQLVSIAAISLFGAYGTPLFFLDIDSNPIVLPVYLISLLVLGLGLAGWKGATFTRLRGIVWWGTVLFGAGWTLFHGVDNPFIALSFLAIAWASFHAELVYTSLKESQIDSGKDHSLTLMGRDFVSGFGARILASSFSLTTWATFLAVIVFNAWKPGLDWLAPAAGVGATAFLALPLGAHLRIFRDMPETDSERLAASLAMQCGALLIATVALGLADWLSVLAWLGLGVAAGVCGTWLRSRPLHVYGIIVLSIATGRLLLLEWWVTTAAVGGVTVYGLYLTRWSVLVAGMGLAWLGAGVSVRIGARTEWKKVSNFCLATGITSLFVALLHSRTSDPAAAAVVVSCALALSITGHRLRSFGMCCYSIGLQPVGLFIALAAQWWLVTTTNAPMGLPVTVWTLLLLYSATVAGITAGLLLKFIDKGKLSLGFAIASAAWSLGFAMAAFVHQGVNKGSLSLVWLLLSGAVFLLGRFELRLRLSSIGLVGMLLSSLAWASAYATGGWNEWTSPLMLHPGLLTSFLIAASIFVSAMRVLRFREKGDVRLVAGIGLAMVLVLMLTASSFEAVRAAHILTSDETSRKTFLSIWWGLFGVGLVLIGFWRGKPILRHVGLGMLSFAAVKTVAYDLVEIAPLWRVASFLGLGLLMLGVAAGYGKLASQLDDDKLAQSTEKI